MENRLIPPSHFDSEENLANEEPWHGDTTPRVAGIQFLRPPEHFSSIAAGGNSNGLLNIGRNTARRCNPGIYPDQCRHQAEGSGWEQYNSPRFHQPVGLPDKYSELLNLKNENDALRSLLENKQRELKQEVCHQISPRNQIHPHEAVVEHQTQHISRLQKDLDEYKSELAKRENELLRYESVLAGKDREISDMKEAAEITADKLRHADNTLQARQQDISELQTVIEELKAQHVCTVKSHAESVHGLREDFEVDKETLRQLYHKQNGESLQKMEEEKSRLCQEMAGLTQRHQTELENLRKSEIERQTEWQEEMEGLKETFRQKSDLLEKELSDLRLKCSGLEESLRQEIVSKEALQSELLATADRLAASLENSDRHLARVNQLQAYISGIQAEDYERSQWKNERTKYEKNIIALQSEKESMNKTMELQNIRLQSITKILTTQEEAINASTKAFTSDTKPGGLTSVVTRRWREKVLELMVRNKCNEISLTHTRDEHKAEERDLREQLEDEKRVSVILESQLTESKAVLEMREAELEEAVSRSAAVNEKLEATRRRLLNAENSAASAVECVKKSVASLNQFNHAATTEMTEKLIHMEQRLVFATNRLRTLQDLYARRENILKAKLTCRQHLSNEDEVEDIPTGHGSSQTERPDLIAEIDRLTEERDSLSHKLSEDSAVFDSATAQFKTLEAKLLADITTLQHDVQSKSEELAEMRETLSNLDDRVQDKSREASDAGRDLRDFIQNRDKTIESKLEEAWQKWNEERQTLLQKLEGSQREHARTVVNFRQNERMAIRNAKRADESLTAITAEHNKELGALKNKIKSLKVDNNLLMTTLRQQGIVSAYKAARKEAKKNADANQATHSRGSVDSVTQKSTSPEKMSSSFKVDTIVSNVSHPGKSKKAVSDSNMEDMLKDLVVMTESILNDSN